MKEKNTVIKRFSPSFFQRVKNLMGVSEMKCDERKFLFKTLQIVCTTPPSLMHRANTTYNNTIKLKMSKL